VDWAGGCKERWDQMYFRVNRDARASLLVAKTFTLGVFSASQRDAGRSNFTVLVNVKKIITISTFTAATAYHLSSLASPIGRKCGRKVSALLLRPPLNRWI
jgi:hypothetical protein